jgi:chromosome segregation ATPase
MAQQPAPIGTPKESGLFPRNGNRPSADDSESEFKPYRGNDSLSVDFLTPLVGLQRGEKVQQMVKSHVSSQSSGPKMLQDMGLADKTRFQPTWQTAEQFQKLLYKASTTIRRMPGVASNESQEISDQLQQIGQIVSRDTVRLVEEHAKTTLDYQDTEKAVGRLSLENNLAKADMEQRVAKFDQLYSDYVAEREKREQYESDIQTITKYLRSLSNDLRGFQAQATAARDACPENERSDIDHLLQVKSQPTTSSFCSSLGYVWRC